MHVGEIYKADIANGIGMRVSLFVSGCRNHCPGCFNQETWDFNYGQLYTPEIEQELMDELAKPYYQGVSILGGEPFEPENQPEVARLIQRIKKELPERDIWMYTGYTYDQDLIPGGCRYTEVTDSILDNIDVLVDGRFVQEKKNIRLRFCGSENQRVINVRKTRAEGKVVLSEYNG